MINLKTIVIMVMGVFAMSFYLIRQKEKEKEIAARANPVDSLKGE